MTTRSGSAKYEGLGKSGKGHVSTQSGVLSDSPYGFNTRFENEPGTNPEELIAAAPFATRLGGRDRHEHRRQDHRGAPEGEHHLTHILTPV